MVYLDPTHGPAPSWLVSSAGRALHRYRIGHGFKSRTGLNFFSGPIFNLLVSVVYLAAKFEWLPQKQMMHIVSMVSVMNIHESTTCTNHTN